MFPVFSRTIWYGIIVFKLGEGKFISEVTVMIEKRRENSEKVKSGWFTPDQMRTELKWVSTLGFLFKARLYIGL